MQNHVASLRAKHAEIEHLIEAESARPAPDDIVMSHLKRRKLRVKESLEQLTN